MPLVSFLVVQLLLIAVMLIAVNEAWASYPLIIADWLLTRLWLGLEFLADLPAATWHTAVLPWPFIFTGHRRIVSAPWSAHKKPGPVFTVTRAHL